MLNLRENIKRLHLNQHQIEINMSASEICNLHVNTILSVN
jgi:hypothetical protein